MDDESSMDLDLFLPNPPAPPKPSRFHPNTKSKKKLKPNSQPKPEPEPVSQPTKPDADEEDAVIREFDVFLAPSLSSSSNSHLYLMQYPLRPSWRPYELNERCEEVRVKNKQPEVEVVLSVDIHSENYSAELLPESLTSHKQILKSSKASSPTEHAVGILIRNKLYLSPVHAILQLRPSIGGEVQKKNKHLEGGAKSDKGKVLAGDSSENIDDAEAWVSLVYNAINSTFSSMYMEKMMEHGDAILHSTLKPSDYLSSLCGGASTSKKKSLPPSRFLPSERLEDRLRKWLCRGRQVHHFRALMQLDSTISEEDFLNMLQCQAYLVQGLWVSKSSLLYEANEAIQRDYILLLFSKKDRIPNDELKKFIPNSTTLAKLLAPLARYRECFDDWKFIEKPDLSFIGGHQNIVQEQQCAWSDREKDIIVYLGRAGNKFPITTKNSRIPNIPSRNTAAGKVDTASIKSSNGTRSSAAMAMSKETLESLSKAVLHILSDRKSRSLTSIQRELRDLALSISSRPKEDPKTKALVHAVANAASLPSPDLLSVVNQVAVKVHEVYVLKSGENTALDPLRSLVIDLFRGKGNNAKLKKQEIKQAAQISLKKDIPDNDYIQVMNDLCVLNKGAWMLRSVE